MHLITFAFVSADDTTLLSESHSERLQNALEEDLHQFVPYEYWMLASTLPGSKWGTGFRGRRKERKKETGWVGKAEIRETWLQSAIKAGQVTFGPSPGLTEKTFDSSGFSAVYGNGVEGDHRHLNTVDREGRWGTTDDFTTSFLHFSLFSTTL